MLYTAIKDKKIGLQLQKLHKASDKQERFLFLRFFKYLPKYIITRKLPWEKLEMILNKNYMAINPDQGEFCYLLAKALNAKHIVEFGTSFGISTIYLALAVKENGGVK